MKLTKKNQSLALEKLRGIKPVTMYLAKGNPNFSEYILNEFQSLVNELETSSTVNSAQFQSRFNTWKANCTQINKGFFESIEWSAKGSKFKYAK
jgi:hypothetical protein